MPMPTLLDLVDAGAHFGHNRSMTYPKARSFVFTVKNGVSLINLEETQNALLKAQELLRQCLSNNKIVLFVGTKNSVRPIVQEIAEGASLPYITERWFGGTLTNFETIIGNIKRMNELDAFLQDEKSSELSKKDRLNSENKLAHYRRFLGGLANLKKVPDLLVLASASADKVAINEANQMGIPVIAICDTDVNPDRLTIAIPANDDAPKAVRLILETLVEKPSVKAKAEAKKEDETEEKPKVEKKAKAESTAKKLTEKETTVKKAVKVEAKPKTSEKAKKKVAKKGAK